MVRLPDGTYVSAAWDPGTPKARAQYARYVERRVRQSYAPRRKRLMGQLAATRFWQAGKRRKLRQQLAATPTRGVSLPPRGKRLVRGLRQRVLGRSDA